MSETYVVEIDGYRIDGHRGELFAKQAAIEYARMHAGVVWQIPAQGLPILVDDFSQPEEKGTRDGGYYDTAA